jgi:hypothetical protein
MFSKKSGSEYLNQIAIINNFIAEKRKSDKCFDQSIESGDQYEPFIFVRIL